MARPKSLLLVTLFCSSFIFIALGYLIQRGNFSQLIGLYTAAFILFGLSYSLILKSRSFAIPLLAGLAFRVALLFYLPNLSDDFYRFVWDGRLLVQGVNPFSYLPVECMSNEHITAYPALLEKLNSTEFYSVYPPVNQFIFFLSTLIFPNSLLGNVVVLKLFILLFEAGTAFLIYHLLVHFKLPKHLLFLYFLNPLIIIELTGNLHFEAVMIFFVLLSIYFAIRHKVLFSSAALSLSIATKLWPIMFIPFFWKRFGLKKSVIHLLGTVVFLSLLFIPFWTKGFFQHFSSSIFLYFNHFEFNGSIYYLVRELGYQLTGYNVIRLVGLWFPVISMSFVALLFLFHTGKDWVSIFVLLLFGLTIYFLFATTVHPWYITPLLAFMLFTRFRYPMAWAILIPLTYITYTQVPYRENTLLVSVEYAILFLIIAFELSKKKQILGRAQIKANRILPYLNKKESILDVGPGNGGLALLLARQGYDVKSLDITNRSFFDEVSPIIYDGNQIPFPDKSFDTVLLITVLHHTKRPEQVLTEANRVASKVIIIEDVHANMVQKYLTFIADSIVNWEFIGHPHNNKTDEEWQLLFKKLNLKMEYHENYNGFLLFFRQVMYVLKS